MAERYRDLVGPTGVDLGARTTPSGGAEAANQLASTFANFSRQAHAVGSTIRSNVGAKEGAEAGQEGTPEFRRGVRALTAYGRAYNNSALRSYAIRQELDLEQQAARLEVEAGTNPEAFAEAMEEIRKATIEEAPAEAHVVLEDIYQRRTAEGLTRINVALSTEIREEDRTLLSEQIEKLAIEMGSLRAGGDVENESLKAAQLDMLLQGAVNDNLISDTERERIIQDTNRRVAFETVVEQFKNEMDDPNGDPISFIEDLKEVNRVSEALSSEDEEKLVNALFEELRERNALASMRDKQMTDERVARHAAGDRSSMIELLRGELNTAGLLKRLERDEISPAVSRTLLNELQSQASAPPKSDQRELASVELNLLSIPEEDILTNEKLTWADRADLIEKRRDEEAGWKGTQRAKEAFDRIDRALGLIPGVNPKFLEERDLRARDEALTELYDVIDSLPPEEREPRILAEADKVVQRIRKRNTSEELEQQREEYEKLLREDTSKMDKRELQRHEDELGRMRNNITQLENQVRGGATQ